jgi:hypothetical protein
MAIGLRNTKPVIRLVCRWSLPASVLEATDGSMILSKLHAVAIVLPPFIPNQVFSRGRPKYAYAVENAAWEDFPDISAICLAPHIGRHRMYRCWGTNEINWLAAQNRNLRTTK